MGIVVFAGSSRMRPHDTYTSLSPYRNRRGLQEENPSHAIIPPQAYKADGGAEAF
jgi:hypothetical protein